jgi:hypothetical protein
MTFPRTSAFNPTNFDSAIYTFADFEENILFLTGTFSSVNGAFPGVFFLSPLSAYPVPSVVYPHVDLSPSELMLLHYRVGAAINQLLPTLSLCRNTLTTSNRAVLKPFFIALQGTLQRLNRLNDLQTLSVYQTDVYFSGTSRHVDLLRILGNW